MLLILELLQLWFLIWSIVGCISHCNELFRLLLFSQLPTKCHFLPECQHLLISHFLLLLVLALIDLHHLFSVLPFVPHVLVRDLMHVVMDTNRFVLHDAVEHFRWRNTLILLLLLLLPDLTSLPR